MKSVVRGLLAVVLLSPISVICEGKGEKVDPRLKEIKTIFVKGDNWGAEQIRSRRASIERTSCLRFAPDAEKADAIMKVDWSSRKEEIRGDVLTSQNNPVYHTLIEIRVREGDKLRKIWAGSVELSDQEERQRSGVWRVMDSLIRDTCETK